MKTFNIDGIIGSDVDAKDVSTFLKEAKGEDVLVNIDSPGGYISQGKTMFNHFKNYSGRVDTHIIGDASSMATYISQVGQKRTAEKNSVFMIHNGWTFAIGDHRDMFRAGKSLDSLSNIIAKQYAESTGKPLEELRGMMDEETSFYGDEIKEAGFVDEIVGDDDQNYNKDESIALAKIAIEECIAKISSPELVKKDMAALAKMMATENTIKPSGEPEKHKQEVIKMTLEKLKAENPDVYNQIMALGQKEGEKAGTEQERARVKGLTEMRGKFKKAHSQNVIDQAISEGHDLATVSINLNAADQAAAELEASGGDNSDPPANGGSQTPEMKDGVMTHPDHVKAQADQIKKIMG